MSELSNAVTPMFNKTIKQIGEADDEQSDQRALDAYLIAIADRYLSSFPKGVATLAGQGQAVILSTQDQFLDGVVQYQDNTAVVIKDGQAVWAGRQIGVQKKV